MTIYPAIDIQGGHCVRLKQGAANETTKYFDDPSEPARNFANCGSTWVHVVDLDGAFAGEPKNLDALKKIAATGLKVQWGGGLRTIENVREALGAGAARVVVGTKAAQDSTFVSELVKTFGSEKIAVGIDAKDGFVAVKGWKDVTSLPATELAQKMATLGVKTIIYTDIATDGMLSGPNSVALKKMLESFPFGVISSGGVSCKHDVLHLRELSSIHENLVGVIVGKALYEKRIDLTDLLKLSAQNL